MIRGPTRGVSQLVGGSSVALPEAGEVVYAGYWSVGECVRKNPERGNDRNDSVSRALGLR